MILRTRVPPKMAVGLGARQLRVGPHDGGPDRAAEHATRLSGSTAGGLVIHRIERPARIPDMEV